MNRLAIAQTLAVARRDFTAKVWSPVFLIFLMLPLLGLVMAGVTGGLLQSSIEGTVSERSVVMVTDDATGRRAQRVAERMADMTSSSAMQPRLVVEKPNGRPKEQLKRITRGADGKVTAVSFDADGRSLVVSISNPIDAQYLAQLRREAARTEPDRPIDMMNGIQEEIGKFGRMIVTYGLVLALILLNQMFVTQISSNLIEERASKLIDALAAAAPLEAILFGKIIAEFSAMWVFLGVYAVLALMVPLLLPPEVAAFLARILSEAGWSTLVVFLCYFATTYLISSITMIGITSIPSNIQGSRIASLPVFGLLLASYGFAFYAMNHVGSTAFLVAAIFPITSPIVMLGGHLGGVNPVWHFVALAWQILWIAGLLTLAARMFRRSALNSTSAPAFGSKRRRPTEAEA